jgi:hypothetical protein
MYLNLGRQANIELMLQVEDAEEETRRKRRRYSKSENLNVQDYFQAWLFGLLQRRRRPLAQGSAVATEREEKKRDR